MSKLTQKYVRTKVWRHNAMLGSVRMAMRNMRAIQESTTATGAAKHVAGSIEGDLATLTTLLRTRVDPK